MRQQQQWQQNSKMIFHSHGREASCYTYMHAYNHPTDSITILEALSSLIDVFYVVQKRQSVDCEAAHFSVRHCGVAQCFSVPVLQPFFSFHICQLNRREWESEGRETNTFHQLLAIEGKMKEDKEVEEEKAVSRKIWCWQDQLPIFAIFVFLPTQVEICTRLSTISCLSLRLHLTLGKYKGWKTRSMQTGRGNIGKKCEFPLDKPNIRCVGTFLHISSTVKPVIAQENVPQKCSQIRRVNHNT